MGETENDKLYTQSTQNNKENEENFEEIKDSDLKFLNLQNEKSVILVDYWKDSKHQKTHKNTHNSQQKIAPWTKYYSRHKNGIGEDLRIALISSQKLKDSNSWNDEHFNETLQCIECKCYFPKIFHLLRQLFGLTLNDFLSSFQANNLLQIGSSQSSLSGCYFFYSFDGKYIIKSMRKEEVTFIKSMLCKYLEYMKQNKENCFLTRFYAMFKIKKTYFLIM